MGGGGSGCQESPLTHSFSYSHPPSPSLHELMNGLRTMGVDLSRAEAQQLLDELDDDNDGSVSYAELAQAVKSLKKAEKR